MRIEKSFTVHSAPANVWAFLTDPHRVARALPGAAIHEQIDAQTYAGTVTVKVGPVATSYKGKMRFERLDQSAGVAEILASGQDVKGKGGAELRMTSNVVQKAPGQTEVNVISDVNITGILAQMGRGMIEQVSDQMFQIFTDAIRAELESDIAPPGGAPSVASAPTAPPIEVVSFGSKLIVGAAGRAVRRPAVLAILIGVAILLVWWLSLR
ncbi:MAG: SRPBCC family protein [Longimicrobiales bacterium]